jgi:bifunctional DNA-binding transcriptional regulator/antitoxin component of YhaV-PrlF toxin-antitoxin module
VDRPVRFRAIIEDAGGGGAYVTVPFDVEAAFGKKRVKVRATIDGELYRGTLVRMGTPMHILLVLKEIRERIGKRPGDEVDVILEEDVEARVVTVPEDLRSALCAEPDAGQLFDTLSYTHQREYVNWIEDAKRPETRERRILKTIDLLRQGN